MPELPDVEVYRRYARGRVKGKRIRSVRVYAEKVLGGISGPALNKGVKGRGIREVRRHGKYFFLELGRTRSLVFHFGMTGFLEFYKEAPYRPEHTRAEIFFQDDSVLAYVCRRMLGKVMLAGEPEEFCRRKNLGEDALSVDKKGFCERLQKGRGRVKSWLMNQRQLAGIGNVYSDEILYQAGIHPATDVRKIRKAREVRLFEQTRHVLREAIHCRADPERMPPRFLAPHRGQDDRCPEGGRKLQKIKIDGRSAYVCPSKQKKPS